MLGGLDIKRTLRSLFRPLIRFCVRHSVKFGDLETILKELFVNEAEKFLKDKSENISVSKLSVMTGLQRPLVTSLQRRAEANSERPGSLLMKVIGAWQTRKEFITAKGDPRVLDVNGKESEFASLVKSVSKALNPYTVLFELQRADMVERSSRGIRLRYGTFVADKNIENGLEFLAADIGDLCRAVDENLFSEIELKNHHVTTEYDSIPEGAIKKVKELFLKEGHKLHQKLRRTLAWYERTGKGQKNEARKVRAAFSSFGGIFHD